MRKAHDCEVFYFFIFFNLNFYKLAKFQYKSFKCLKRPIYINSIKYFIWERLTMVNCFNSINIFIQERIMIVKLLFIYLNELELSLLFFIKYFIWERLTIVNCFNSINIFIQERITIVKLLFIYLNELELSLLFLLLESLSRCHSFFSPKMQPLVHFHNKRFKYLKKIILNFFFYIGKALM